MLDAVGAAPVLEAGGKTFHQPYAAVGFTEQQATRIGGDLASVKSGRNPPFEVALKFEAGLIKLCHSERPFFSGVNC
jgi:hypothetical protein